MLLAADEVAQGIEGFRHFVANEACRLSASTPGAGQYPIKHHLIAHKHGSGAARLGAALLAQIALGCTVVETKARRIAGAARSIRVTHEGGMPRLPKRLPRIDLRPRVVGARQQRQYHPQSHTERPRYQGRPARPQLRSSGRIGSGKNSIPSSLRALASSAVASPWMPLAGASS